MTVTTNNLWWSPHGGLYEVLELADRGKCSEEKLVHKLASHEPWLLHTLSCFKPSNDKSKSALLDKTVAAGGPNPIKLSAKLRTAAYQVSAHLNLDEVQAYIVLKRFLENAKQAGKPIEVEGALEPKVLDEVTLAYHAERIRLLNCLHSLVRICEDVTGANANVYAKAAGDCLHRLLDQGLEKELLVVLTGIVRADAPRKLNERQLRVWWEQNLLEQTLLLEILFLLYYSRVQCSAASLSALLLTFQENVSLATAIAESRTAERRGATDSSTSVYDGIMISAEGPLSSSAASWSQYRLDLFTLLFVEAMRMECLLEALDGHKDSWSETGHPFRPEDVASLDRQLSAWWARLDPGSAPAVASMQLAWATFLQLATKLGLDAQKHPSPNNTPERIRQLGDQAYALGSLPSLLRMLRSAVLRDYEPHAAFFKYVVKNLMAAVVAGFAWDTKLAAHDDVSLFVDVLSEVFHDQPDMCDEFWSEEGAHDVPLRACLVSLRSWFPLRAVPLLRLLAALCGSQYSAHKALEYLDMLPAVTWAKPDDRAVVEFEDGPEGEGLPLLQLREPLTIPFGFGFSVPAGALGRAHPYDEGLVEWQYAGPGGVQLVLDWLRFYVVRGEGLADGGGVGRQLSQQQDELLLLCSVLALLHASLQKSQTLVAHFTRIDMLRLDKLQQSAASSHGRGQKPAAWPLQMVLRAFALLASQKQPRLPLLATCLSMAQIFVPWNAPQVLADLDTYALRGDQGPWGAEAGIPQTGGLGARKRVSERVPSLLRQVLLSSEAWEGQFVVTESFLELLLALLRQGHRGPQVQAYVLYVMDEVMAGHPSMSFKDRIQRWRVLAKAFEILSEAVGVWHGAVKSPAAMWRAGKSDALYRLVTDAMLTHAPHFSVLLRVLSIDAAAFELHSLQREVLRAEALAVETAVRSALSLLNGLLSVVARRMAVEDIDTSLSPLEKALFDGITGSRHRSIVAAVASYMDYRDSKPLQLLAVTCLTLLCYVGHNTRPCAVSLSGYLMPSSTAAAAPSAPLAFGQALMRDLYRGPSSHAGDASTDPSKGAEASSHHSGRLVLYPALFSATAQLLLASLHWQVGLATLYLYPTPSTKKVDAPSQAQTVGAAKPAETSKRESGAAGVGDACWNALADGTRLLERHPDALCTFLRTILVLWKCSHSTGHYAQAIESLLSHAPPPSRDQDRFWHLLSQCLRAPQGRVTSQDKSLVASKTAAASLDEPPCDLHPSATGAYQTLAHAWALRILLLRLFQAATGPEGEGSTQGAPSSIGGTKLTFEGDGARDVWQQLGDWKGTAGESVSETLGRLCRPVYSPAQIQHVQGCAMLMVVQLMLRAVRDAGDAVDGLATLPEDVAGSVREALAWMSQQPAALELLPKASQLFGIRLTINGDAHTDMMGDNLLDQPPSHLPLSNHSKLAQLTPIKKTPGNGASSMSALAPVLHLLEEVLLATLAGRPTDDPGASPSFAKLSGTEKQSLYRLCAALESAQLHEIILSPVSALGPTPTHIRSASVAVPWGRWCDAPAGATPASMDTDMFSVDAPPSLGRPLAYGDAFLVDPDALLATLGEWVRSQPTHEDLGRGKAARGGGRKQHGGLMGALREANAMLSNADAQLAGLRAWRQLLSLLWGGGRGSKGSRSVLSAWGQDELRACTKSVLEAVSSLLPSVTLSSGAFGGSPPPQHPQRQQPRGLAGATARGGPAAALSGGPAVIDYGASLCAELCALLHTLLASLVQGPWPRANSGKGGGAAPTLGRQGATTGISSSRREIADLASSSLTKTQIAEETGGGLLADAAAVVATCLRACMAGGGGGVGAGRSRDGDVDASSQGEGDVDDAGMGGMDPRVAGMGPEGQRVWVNSSLMSSLLLILDSAVSVTSSSAVFADASGAVTQGGVRTHGAATPSPKAKEAGLLASSSLAHVTNGPSTDASGVASERWAERVIETALDMVPLLLACADSRRHRAPSLACLSLLVRAGATERGSRFHSPLLLPLLLQGAGVAASINELAVGGAAAAEVDLRRLLLVAAAEEEREAARGGSAVLVPMMADSGPDTLTTLPFSSSSSSAGAGAADASRKGAESARPGGVTAISAGSSWEDGSLGALVGGGASGWTGGGARAGGVDAVLGFFLVLARAPTAATALHVALTQALMSYARELLAHGYGRDGVIVPTDLQTTERPSSSLLAGAWGTDAIGDAWSSFPKQPPPLRSPHPQQQQRWCSVLRILVTLLRTVGGGGGGGGGASVASDGIMGGRRLAAGLASSELTGGAVGGGAAEAMSRLAMSFVATFEERMLGACKPLGAPRPICGAVGGTGAVGGNYFSSVVTLGALQETELALSLVGQLARGQLFEWKFRSPRTWERFHRACISLLASIAFPHIPHSDAVGPQGWAANSWPLESVPRPTVPAWSTERQRRLPSTWGAPASALNTPAYPGPAFAPMSTFERQSLSRPSAIPTTSGVFGAVIQGMWQGAYGGDGDTAGDDERDNKENAKPGGTSTAAATDATTDKLKTPARPAASSPPLGRVLFSTPQGPWGTPMSQGGQWGQSAEGVGSAAGGGGGPGSSVAQGAGGQGALGAGRTAAPVSASAFTDAVATRLVRVAALALRPLVCAVEAALARWEMVSELPAELPSLDTLCSLLDQSLAILADVMANALPAAINRDGGTASSLSLRKGAAGHALLDTLAGVARDSLFLQLCVQRRVGMRPSPVQLEELQAGLTRALEVCKPLEDVQEMLQVLQSMFLKLYPESQTR
eukprot:jgi/Mesvir1/887/Mv17453-RA.1